MPVNPKILTIPFARDAAPGLVNTIPSDPNPSVPQRASWKQGFPSITMIPLTAGGIPPQGQDFNGAIRDITEHVVYRNAGGQYKFSSTIVAELGGYSQGAVIESDDGLSLWVSLEDDNMENFNTVIGTPEKWARIAFSGLDQALAAKVNNTQIKQEIGSSETDLMSQGAITQALAQVADSVQWLGTPIGSVITLDTSLGVDEPPTDSGLFRYVKLTAGETGSGDYNEGVLINEDVNAAWVDANGHAGLSVTAEISTGSLAGKVIHLMNSEGSIIRAGTVAGVLSHDQMQRITGSSGRPVYSSGHFGFWENDFSGAIGSVGGSSERIASAAIASASSRSQRITFNSANSPDARTSSTTDGATKDKDVTFEFYMRIA